MKDPRRLETLQVSLTPTVNILLHNVEYHCLFKDDADAWRLASVTYDIDILSQHYFHFAM